MYCDLHTHSVFSDGDRTPEEILLEAREKQLVVALTDHNTVSGLPSFMEAAARLGVDAVPGVEFSTDYQGREVHVVALFVGPEHYAAIREFVAEGDRQKVESNKSLVEKLREAGYDLSYGEIVAGTPDGRVNRANIGSELVKKGYFSTVKEAFSTVLGEKHGFYVPPKRPAAEDTVAFIAGLGALPVLAHPYLSLSRDAVEQLLTRSVPRGLVAMETEYPSYDEETTAFARAAARRHGLLISGGSDFHGAVKPNNPLGQPVIPIGVYETLKAKV